MKPDFSIELNPAAQVIWDKLPIGVRKEVTERALNALFTGRRYPRGGDQLELVIDLIDAGLDVATISTVSGLVTEMVEDFIPKQ